MGSSMTSSNTPVEPAQSSYTAPKRPTGTGMKLGGKKKDVNQFVDQLTSEGEKVEDMPSAAGRKTPASKISAIPEVDKERYASDISLFLKASTANHNHFYLNFVMSPEH